MFGDGVLQHLVDDAPRLRLLGGHEVVAVGVALSVARAPLVLSYYFRLHQEIHEAYV